MWKAQSNTRVGEADKFCMKARKLAAVSGIRKKDVHFCGAAARAGEGWFLWSGHLRMLQLCSSCEVSAHMSFDCLLWLPFMQTILIVVMVVNGPHLREDMHFQRHSTVILKT